MQCADDMAPLLRQHAPQSTTRTTTSLRWWLEIAIWIRFQ